MPRGAVILVGNAPDREVAGAAEIEVDEGIGRMTTYRIRYPLAIADGDLPLLAHRALSPGSELAIVVADGHGSAMLVKGPVYAQRCQLQHGGAGSYVDVIGGDAGVLMDRENKAAVWANQSDSAVVSAVLASYGLTPAVSSTATVHGELKHALVQRETDLALVRRLARRNGFCFWITADAGTGRSTGHFARPGLTGAAAHRLALNVTPPNLDALELDWNIERPTSSAATQLDLNTREDIAGDVQCSPLDALGTTALADIDGRTRRMHLAAPVDDAGDLSARGEAALIEAGFFVRARAGTSADRLGGVLRSHTLVNLQGAGTRHSGHYLCARVVHRIDDSVHAMRAELWRNGWNN